LAGTILDGITRRSILTLASEMGLEIEQRALTVDEIFAGIESGRLTEAFGTGTAVVVSPIGQFSYAKRTAKLGDGQTTGAITKTLYDTLTGIQYGRLPDPYGWVVPI
jgi:branched-chain amino acid aminotransferase